jgi:HD-GYP domain-containing protein (c-di-GMP phosphodiesterase class II)
MRRVGIYARLLAKTLGMPDKFCEEMELFAPMHDIGKVGISDTILLVNRPLTQEEYEEIKKHTLLGYTIVRDKEELKTAAEIILYHHERWDGKGYPYGLKGEAIPLSARITAIADVYDALRSKRPYKEEWTHEKSVQEIVKNSGLAFDPRVVQVFLQLAKQFDEVYTRLKD